MLRSFSAKSFLETSNGPFLNRSIIDEFNPLLNQDGNEMSLFSLGNASSKCPFSIAMIVYQSVTHPRINPIAKAGESIMFFASLG